MDDKTKKATSEDLLADKIRAEYDAKIAALQAENDSLKAEKETGIALVEGIFKATVKEKGEVSEKEFSFAAGSPLFFDHKGEVIHAASCIAVANGGKVDADTLRAKAAAELKKSNARVAELTETFLLKEYSQEACQTMLQRLVDMGYQYLITK